jgi:2-C-methyl-D-erythritol 4-phosphate cytidylyltransferase
MPPPAPFCAILVAAGRSSRMGSDKLWVDLWGRPTWRWSLDALLATPGLERVVLVVAADALTRFSDALAPDRSGLCLVAVGGDSRADSVIAGIWALTGVGYGDETLVLVHDAARPAVLPELISSVAEAAAGGEVAVVPVVGVVDSLKRVRGGRVVAPVERAEVVAAQTPQASRSTSSPATRPITSSPSRPTWSRCAPCWPPGPPAHRSAAPPRWAPVGTAASASTPIGWSTGARCASAA